MRSGEEAWGTISVSGHPSGVQGVELRALWQVAMQSSTMLNHIFMEVTEVQRGIVVLGQENCKATAYKLRPFDFVAPA